MRMKSRTVLAVLALMVVLTIAAVRVHAQGSASMGAVALCEYAKQRYEEGYRDDAIHEFRKLLLIDPTNQVVRAYLDAPGIEREIGYLRAQIALLTARLNRLDRVVTESCPAKGSSEAGAVLCDYAKELYEAGYLADAKHEFSKLLMIDPGNKTAEAFLREPGVERETEYLKQRIAALTDRLHALEDIMKKSCE